MTAMHTRFWIQTLVAGAALVLSADLLLAQEDRHVRLPQSENDLSPAERAEFVNERLTRAKSQLHQRLAQELLKDPTRLKEMMEELKGSPLLKNSQSAGDLNNPGFRKMVEDFIDKQDLLKSGDRNRLFSDDELKTMKQALGKGDGRGPNLPVESARPPEASQGSPSAMPPVAEVSAPPSMEMPRATTTSRPRVEPLDDADRERRAQAAHRFRRWAEKLQEASPALARSPALRKAIQNLERFQTEGQIDSLKLTELGGGLAKWLPDIGNLPKLDGVLPESDWAMAERLAWLPTPRMRFPSTTFGGDGARWSASDTGPPGRPSWLAWLLLVPGLLLAFLGWRMLSSYKVRLQAASKNGWRLGPWPVRPADVRSRQEIVKAFEYLSLRMLGAPALCQNHLAISSNMQGRQPAGATTKREAAASLATLYERARYSPESDSFGDGEIRLARRQLCLLAGEPVP